MDLKQQVVSLELAQKLKELGVKQESYFWWWASDHLHPGNHVLTKKPDTPIEDDCSAFNVAELLEILHDEILELRPCNAGWEVHRSYGSDVTHSPYKVESRYTSNKKAADSLAEMLIYLVKQKLI